MASGLRTQLDQFGEQLILCGLRPEAGESGLYEALGVAELQSKFDALRVTGAAAGAGVADDWPNCVRWLLGRFRCWAVLVVRIIV